MHDEEELQRQALRNEFTVFLSKAKALFEQDPSTVSFIGNHTA